MSNPLVTLSGIDFNVSRMLLLVCFNISSPMVNIENFLTGQFYSFTVYMVCANSIVNPFVYAIQYDEFKNRVREIFCEKPHPLEGFDSTHATSLSTVDKNTE